MQNENNGIGVNSAGAIWRTGAGLRRKKAIVCQTLSVYFISFSLITFPTFQVISVTKKRLQPFLFAQKRANRKKRKR